ncbi:PIN domain-containing protein [Sunxiuqinia indica]|uniref:PIN domain-containing protein n=1 Tax=Sunxiuqinia indica TaxID=2692584 RepID=UPI00135BB4C7|nr:PIN domain-containing protein [Sunxiuqinia indica]
MIPKPKIILDTNIIIKLDDDGINPELVKSVFEVYSSIAQLSEIKADNNLNRQNSRLKYYDSLSPISLNLESGALFSKLILNYDTPLTNHIGEVFNEIKGESNKQNTWIDALIAEIAKENNLILVTDEKKIIARALRHEISVMNYNEFRHEIGK